MKTQTKTKEEKQKMIFTILLVGAVIGFTLGIFFGLGIAINSPECSERETTTEVLKYECDGFWFTTTGVCESSSWEDCVETDRVYHPICSKVPYEKQIIKEIKK